MQGRHRGVFERVILGVGAIAPEVALRIVPQVLGRGEVRGCRAAIGPASRWPAPSPIITACSSAEIVVENGSRNVLMIGVSSCGLSRLSACPVSGQTAPTTHRDWYSVWRTALGREPRGAQTLVVVPCWPNRDSSGKSTRSLLSGCAAAIALIRSGHSDLKASLAAGTLFRCRGRGLRSLSPRRCSNQDTLDRDTQQAELFG